jgi:RNA polymerase sigma-70 factor (ECF subfamily)
VTVHEIAVLDDPLREGLGGRGPSPGDALSDADLIRRAFARLDADKRTILILHHVDERPISEIARILQIPEGTAKWRLHAARRALERALEVEGR